MNSTRLAFAIIASLTSFLSSPETSAATDELHLYSKCYSDLTGTHLPSNDSHLSAVRNGTQSAIDACLEILDLASLQSDGLTKAESQNLPTRDQTIALNVLSHFHDFHRGWFSSVNFQNALQLNDPDAMEDIYDLYQAADYISYALFQPNEDYRNILSGTQTFRTIREYDSEDGVITSSPAENFVHDQGYLIANDIKGNMAYQSLPKWTPLMLERGTLHGFRKHTNSELNQKIYVNHSRNATGEVVTAVNYLKGKGGGLIGSPSYFMGTSGLGRTGNNIWEYQNGTSVIARRWAKSIFSDLFCRELPVADYQDIQKYIRPNSDLPFRSNPSCAQCHTSMDGMAAVSRNLSPKPAVRTAIPPDQTLNFVNSVHLHEFPVSPIPNAPRKSDGSIIYYQTDPNAALPSESDYFSIPSSGDSHFHEREPSGRFVYRSASGVLMDRSINSLEALGHLISQMDDFYSCTAQRYWNFFTGDSINYSSTITNEDPARTTLRDQIKSWGADLKKNQNLKQLIEEILRSSVYQEKSLERP